MNHRFFEGNIQYYIKWLGYSSAENTWESTEHFSEDALLLAQEYLKSTKPKTPVNVLEHLKPIESKIRINPLKKPERDEFNYLGREFGVVLNRSLKLWLNN